MWRDILGDEAGNGAWDRNVMAALNTLLENLEVFVGGGEVGVIGVYSWVRVITQVTA